MMIDREKLELKILETIRTADDKKLFDKGFEEELQKNYLQPYMCYAKEKSDKIIAAQILTKSIAPEGFDYEKEVEYPFVEFRFAIEGNYAYQEEVFDKEFLTANNLSKETIKTNVYLIYKMFNKTAIESDPIFLEKINEETTVIRTLIENRIAAFNIAVDETNKVLQPFINGTLEAEKIERERKKATLQALNPF